MMHGAIETRTIWPRIALVVEDDSTLQELLAETLREAGFRVHATHTPPDPADIGRLQPDVVLLDLVLAGAFAGLDWLRALRAALWTAGTTVVVCSGHNGLRTRVERESLATAVLAKPFGIDELLAAVAADRATAGIVHPIN